MATDSIEWMLQGILTSLLSGVGFYIITRALEYAKKYCQRERQRAMFMGRYFDREENFDWQAFNGITPPGSDPFRTNVCHRAQAIFAAYKRSSAFLCHNKHAEDESDDDSTSSLQDRPLLWPRLDQDCSKNISSLLRFKNRVFQAGDQNETRGHRVYREPSCTSRVKLWSQSSKEVTSSGTDSVSTHTDQTEEFSFKSTILNKSNTVRTTTPVGPVGNGDADHNVCHKRKHPNLLMQTDSEVMTATYSSYESMKEKGKVAHIFCETDSSDTERSLTSMKEQCSFFNSLASSIPRPREAITFRSETTTLTKRQSVVNRAHVKNEEVALVSDKRLGGDDVTASSSQPLPESQYFQGWATWFAVTHLPLSRLFHSSTELSEILKGPGISHVNDAHQKRAENLDLDENHSPPGVYKERMVSGCDKEYAGCHSQTKLIDSKKSIMAAKKPGTRHKKKSASPKHVVIRRHSPPKSPKKRNRGNRSASPKPDENKKKIGSKDKNDEEKSVSPYVNEAVLSLKPVEEQRKNSIVFMETASPKWASSSNRAATVSLKEKKNEASLSPVKEVGKTSYFRDSDKGHISVAKGEIDEAYDARVGSPVDKPSPRRTPENVKVFGVRQNQLTPRQHEKISRNDKSILCSPTRFEKATMCQPTLREKATAFTPETRNKATIASPKMKSPIGHSEIKCDESLILEAENDDRASSCSGVIARAAVGAGVKLSKQKRLNSFKTKKQASFKTLASKQVKNKRRIPGIPSEQKQLTKENTARASVSKEWPDKTVKNAKKIQPKKDSGQNSRTDKQHNNLKREKSKTAIEKKNKEGRLKSETCLSPDSGMAARQANATENVNSLTVTENSKKSAASKDSNISKSKTTQRKDQQRDDTTLSVSGYGDCSEVQKTATDVPAGRKQTEFHESPIPSIHDYSMTVCQSRVQDTFGPIITYHPKSQVNETRTHVSSPSHPGGSVQRKKSLGGILGVAQVRNPSPAQLMLAETSPKPTSVFGSSSLLQSGKKISPAVQSGGRFPPAVQSGRGLPPTAHSGRKFPPATQQGRRFPPAAQPNKKISRPGHTIQPAVKNKPSTTHTNKKLPHGLRPATVTSHLEPVQLPAIKTTRDKKSQGSFHKPFLMKSKKTATNELMGTKLASGRESGLSRDRETKNKKPPMQASKPPLKKDERSLLQRGGGAGHGVNKPGGKTAPASNLSQKGSNPGEKPAANPDTPRQEKSSIDVGASKTTGSDVKQSQLQDLKERSTGADEIPVQESDVLIQSTTNVAPTPPSRIRKVEVKQTVITSTYPSPAQSTFSSHDPVLSRLAPIAEHQQPTMHALDDVTPRTDTQQAPVAFYNVSPGFKIGSPPRAFRNSSPSGVGSTPASNSFERDAQPEDAHHVLSPPDSHRRMVTLRKSALDDVVKQIQLLH